MRARKSLKVVTRTQKSNYYNNIASAWFIAGVITPFITLEQVSLLLIFRAILSLMISKIYLDKSIRYGASLWIDLILPTTLL